MSIFRYLSLHKLSIFQALELSPVQSTGNANSYCTYYIRYAIVLLENFQRDSLINLADKPSWPTASLLYNFLTYFIIVLSDMCLKLLWSNTKSSITSHNNQSTFLLTWFQFNPSIGHMPSKMLNEIIYLQTSMAVPLKFGRGLVISNNGCYCISMMGLY